MNQKWKLRILLAFCVMVFMWTAALPFTRAFRLTEISYNEGWNVYNTQRVAEHQPLYPVTYAWTCVNYPALSFHIVAELGRFTSSYLFTARFLSLAGLCLSGVLAGLIIWKTTQSQIAAWLTGVFLIAVFCANADCYVGVDDPQLLAQFFFLAGFYVYLVGNRKGWTLEAAALLFVIAGNIKHNQIEFPLAVLVDLAISSPRRALRYATGGALMAAISVLLTRQIDGAAYISCLLVPRAYSIHEAFSRARDVLGPMLLPFVVALWMAWYCCKNPAQRVLALLMICALVVNIGFCGGRGVFINGMFGSLLATVLLLGVFWAEYAHLPLGRIATLPQVVVFGLTFLWLAIPMVVSGNWRTDEALERSRCDERRFIAEVDYLRQRPGPALCESLLRCYYADKPYLYDPFNATRFIEQGRLDASVIAVQLRNREYSAVQLDDSEEKKLFDAVIEERFVPPILDEVHRDYRLGLTNEDGNIYVLPFVPSIPPSVRKHREKSWIRLAEASASELPVR